MQAELVHEGEHWWLAPRAQEVSQKKPLNLVPALERSIQIIAYLNRQPAGTATLTQIATDLGVSKTHCFSILKTLVHHDWLRFNPTGKTYQLQSGILRDASSLLTYASLLDNVRPHLRELVERVRIPCVVSQPLADDSFLVVDKLNVPHVLEVSVPVGHRFSRNAPAQMRAFLAWQSPDRIDRWFESWQPTRYTPSTLTDEAALRRELEETRRRGYARSEGEFTEGFTAIALPIFDASGNVAFVFNCGTLLSVMQPKEKLVASELIATAGRIHRSIGARTPPGFPTS